MRFETRALAPADVPAVCALYARGGRDGAWCTAGVCTAVCAAGCWQGVFSGGALLLCLARVPAAAPVAQAQALRASHPPAALPPEFLLPPGLAPDHAADAPALLGAALEAMGAPGQGALACVPVKTGTPLLAGFLGAGFAAVCVRPLERLRPHYLLLRRSAEAFAPDTVRLPLADTLAVSRLLEQGFCLTALHPGEAGAPPTAELRRAAGAP